jgi:hypothetical protein
MRATANGFFVNQGTGLTLQIHFCCVL